MLYYEFSQEAHCIRETISRNVTSDHQSLSFIEVEQ